ncbi:MAG: helix-turn-helix domain-containing protein [Lysobacter sp.]
MDAQRLLEETRDRLRKLEGRYAEFHRASGISYSSLTKFAQGHETNPTVASLQRLIEALDAFEGVQPPPAAEMQPPTTGAAQ